MTEHILVPTDLSRNAREAFKYAIEMAKKLRASITLYHAWSSPQLDPRLSFKEQKGEMLADKRKKERRLKLWCEVAEEQKVHASYIMNDESVIGGTRKLTATGEYDLVVMGTKGVSGIRQVIMGSNTAAVINSSKIPVIAVPSSAKFAGLKNIVLAIDYQDADIEGIKYLEGFAGVFRSKITAVHISGPDFTDDFEHFMLNNFAAKIEKKFPGMKLQYKLVKEEEVIKGLKTFVSQTNPDMVVMVTEKRSFLGRMIWGNLTGRMAFRTKVPLLAIPAKND